MPVRRKLIATMWDGPRVLGFTRFLPDELEATVDGLDDEQVAQALARIQRADHLAGPIPATPEGRRARLRDFPAPEDLDVIADSLTASNQGVRPVVRLLEVAGRRP